MADLEKIKQIAIETIEIETEAVHHLTNFIDADFTRCVETILNTSGRVVISGIGKSAIIANKIVATLNSTGTPSIFMHAADAIHGDLGIIQPNDIVICISKSGNTPEIKALVPMLKSWGNVFIAMVGNLHSYLAQEADIVLNTTVEKEACPNNLAPTSSSTAQLVMGDALAVSLLKMKGFTDKDFAKYHPGGALGKQLYLKVDDLYKNNASPSVSSDTSLREVIMEISSNRLGATAVVDKGKLMGIITDGDLRRAMEKGFADLMILKAEDIMNLHPKTIDAHELATTAMDSMKKNNISQLIVIEDSLYKGILHIHDLLREGIN